MINPLVFPTLGIALGSLFLSVLPSTLSVFTAVCDKCHKRVAETQTNKIVYFIHASYVTFQIIMGAKNSRKQLPAEDLEFLMVNTRYDEATITEWYKGFKQDCPDGKLSTQLFMKIYSKCFPAGKADEFCAHVFRTFDSDNNGFIDFKEFLLAVDVTSAGSPEEKLNWAFR